MWHGFVRSALLAALAATALVLPAAADQPRRSTTVTEGGAHRASPYYRKGPQVRGYAARRGGYSFSAGDVVNTYGNNRSIYGGANAYRDRNLDRQTPYAPFDHGFFFDSGVTLRGGNSPYPN